ncbi:MAG: DUF2892 domain-containing protein [Candidatus Zixiibacteriota bacterium]|nr:MAG: DUF2892 domain-containing protein [candidate division Zixibacteria bacterium]
MSLENSIRMIAGLVVLFSLAMSIYVSEFWLILNAFVGFNLLQSSITKFCPAEIIMRKLFFSKKIEIID